MNKKYLCGVLSAAVLLGAYPNAVFAEDITKSLDFRSATENLSGDGWTWDASNLTLTLENFSVTVQKGNLEERAAIYLPEESTIRVNGNQNEIIAHAYDCDAIYCEGELTFEGKGTLKITTDSYSAGAIYAVRGPVSFYDDVEIATEPEGYAIYVENAKGQNPIISVQDDAKVTFPKENANKSSILVTKSSSTKQGENWFDYAETYDEFDDTIALVAKDEVKKNESKTDDKTDGTKTDETKPDETKAVNEYLLTIGSNEILKNGTVAYTADVAPYIKDGYTMLPLRALLAISAPEQALNWDAAKRTASTVVNGKSVLLTPDAATYQKGNEAVALSTSITLKDGRLFLSLRDWLTIMEQDASSLTWDDKTKTVTLKN